MADGLRPPSLFSPQDAAKEWPQWRDHFEFYLKATKKDKESGPTQVAILLTAMGREAVSLYKTFTWADNGDKDKLEAVLAAFTTHFKPKTNEIYERFIFLQRKQRSGEPFDTFYTDLLRMVETCAYHAAEKTKILRDQIVMNISSDTVREKLLAESGLTVEKAVDMCRSMEATTQYLTSMSTAGTSPKECDSEGASAHAVQEKKSRQQGRQQDRQTLCYYCATRHKPRACPAWGKKCSYCNKMNHAAEACKQAEKDRRDKKETASTVTPSGTDPSDEEETNKDHFVSTVSRRTSLATDRAWHIILDIHGRGLKAKVDTGATCNILPHQAYKALCEHPPEPTNTLLTAYGGAQLTVRGKTSLETTFEGVSRKMEFIIVAENVEALIGLPTLRQMGLIQQAQSITERQKLPESISQFTDVFQGLGQLPGTHTIRLQQNAQPTIQPARRVPFKYRQQLRTQLEEMVDADILAKVTEATAWASPIVLVTKPGSDKLRICMDPSALNKAIQREHYQIKTPEEIFANLAGTKFFSTLDATSGFLQVALDEDSSYLTTIATPFGRYRYLRLPFGISSAPEVFHRIVTEAFSDIPGVHRYVDDILVSGTTQEEHDERLKLVLQRCRELNFKLNLDKCLFGKTELPYLGHILTTEGIQPDPAKIEAIQRFPQPRSKADVSRLLGMITYLAKFCPDLAEVAKPLRQLTQKDVPWTWDAIQDETVTRLRKLVSNTPTLRHFDPRLPITVTVDASSYGLGAALMQDGHPVEYASRTMTSTQQRYAQVEKEMLAVQFGLERFHQYIYGQTITVETDHKPLLGITRKPLNEVSPRLQRMRLRGLRYHYNLEYRPGRDMVLADTLSRAPTATEYDGHTALTEEQISTVLQQTIPTPVGQARCREATRQDPTLQAIRTYMTTGWPSLRKAVPGIVRPFWTVRHDLTEKDDIIFKGSQAVVPTALRRTVLDSIHDGHFGIVKCLERAKNSVYWPGYIHDIQDKVASCSRCQEGRNENPRLPYEPHQVPFYPYQKVGMDLFELDGKTYLMSVDYYSKWITITNLDHTKSRDVIEAVDEQFANFGIPEEVISDNGPQFACTDFRSFADRLGFRHVTSSPGYPSSNGQAERSIQTAKKTMSKMFADGRSLPDVLRALRCTPIGDGLPSPAELLQSRRLRTQLAVDRNALEPQVWKQQEVREKLEKQQGKHAFHDRSMTMAPHPLIPGENVRVRKDGTWVPAQVVSHHTTPRSYLVRVMGGRILRRNQSQINRTAETWPQSGPTIRTTTSEHISTQESQANSRHTPEQPPGEHSIYTEPSVPPPETPSTRNDNQEVITRSGRVSRQPAYLAANFVT